MTNEEKKGFARLCARVAHEGQLDDEGKDYFEAHIEPVARIVSLVTDDVDIICAAYLHDVIEDTKMTELSLRFTFGHRITDLVLEVTHEGKKDNYGYYFPRLHSKDAIIIKFADRLSNLSRMGAWPTPKREQYLRKSKFWKSSKDD